MRERTKEAQITWQVHRGKWKEFSDGFGAMVHEVCEDTLRSDIYAQKLHDANFMLCDVSLPCCPILADKLGIQRVDILPTGFGDPILSIIHNFPASLAQIPQFPCFVPMPKPSFFGRVQNLMIYSLMYVHTFHFTGLFRKLRKQYTPNSKYENLEGLVRSTGLLLIPVDFALAKSRTIEPYMKVVGPILPEPSKPLPYNFLEIISSGPFRDVVLVSFGTIISDFKEGFVDTVISALNEIPATVIWKYKGKMPPNVGQNVKIVPWFPQNDLLGNSATKVFVTHAGLNSIYEACFHGVPMVVVPFFADQFSNALEAVNTGKFQFPIQDGILVVKSENDLQV
ncbi:UDP-glucuronosyltransferase 2A3 [Exaiptasia diaphana]|nr:UDP-glucuronosyltransferase 2A3 [Exaiptasia diaphana]